jgi:hypothetical protein
MFDYSSKKLEALRKLFITFIVIMVMAAGGLGSSFGLAAGPAQADGPTLPQLITFSTDSVVTHQPVQINLASSIGGVIRYTTNGSLPTAGSSPYISPLLINQPTVIRAQLFDPQGQPLSEVQTKSYLTVGYDQTIPIVSIAAGWTDLNALHTYAYERGDEWERPMNLEYFAPGGQVQFNVKAGLRIHGGKSRRYSPKKSYRIYFRQAYGGPAKLDYPLFEDSLATSFDKLVLRAGYNDSFTYVGASGERLNNQSLTAKYIGDQVTRNLHRDMGQPIAHGKWVLLYLNGQFWGLYNLTERIDLEFFQAYSAPESDWDIIAKESGYDQEGIWFNVEEAKAGDYGAWLENQDWVGSADFTNSGNIGVLEWRTDVENLFSYVFLEAYVQNYDWPGNNWIVYRRKDPGFEGKWRMIVWDAEYSFGSGSEGFRTDINTLERVHSPHDSVTRLLEKPFHNCGFKVRFVERAREYLGLENLHNRPPNEVGQLSKERVKTEILNQAAIVRPFIQMEADRWAPGLGMGVELFDRNIANALKFVDDREAAIVHHLDILRYQSFKDCR